MRTSRTFTALALVPALLVGTAPWSSAQPAEPPDTATSRYHELSQASERTNQDVLTAHQELADTREALDVAIGASERSRQAADDALAAETSATAVEQQALTTANGLRDDVDHMVEISFKGLRLNGLAAIFSSESPEEFLDAATIMDYYAGQQSDIVAAAVESFDAAARTRLLAENARTEADTASRVADEDRDAAQRLTDEAITKAEVAEQRKVDLDREIEEVRRSLDRMAAAERAQLTSTGPAAEAPLTEGAAGDAVRFALTQVGKPYVWGATGPDTYDCSGLMQTAYRSAGVAIPRTTYTQAVVGAPVGRDQVRAGDLVLYHDTVSHVAMAIDGTLAVHASTAGEPVKVGSIDGIGPIATIRRISS